jgi:hypothetical protein
LKESFYMASAPNSDNNNQLPNQPLYQHHLQPSASMSSGAGRIQPTDPQDLEDLPPPPVPAKYDNNNMTATTTTTYIYTRAETSSMDPAGYPITISSTSSGPTRMEEFNRAGLPSPPLTDDINHKPFLPPIDRVTSDKFKLPYLASNKSSPTSSNGSTSTGFVVAPPPPPMPTIQERGLFSSSQNQHQQQLSPGQADGALMKPSPTSFDYVVRPTSFTSATASTPAEEEQVAALLEEEAFGPYHPALVQERRELREQQKRTTPPAAAPNADGNNDNGNEAGNDDEDDMEDNGEPILTRHYGPRLVHFIYKEDLALFDEVVAFKSINPTTSFDEAMVVFRKFTILVLHEIILIQCFLYLHMN